MKTRVLFLALIMVLAGGMACAEGDGMERYVPGEVVKISAGRLIALDKASFVAIIDALRIGDTEGVMEIMDTGSATPLSCDVSARVLGVDGDYLRMRILDGPLYSIVVWSHRGLVSKAPRG